MNATCLAPPAARATVSGISHARDGATCVIRLAGDLRHTQGPAFDRFIDGVLNDIGIERVIVDVGDATGIDSTMLGLLARLALGLADRDGRKPLLVSPRADINVLLDSICLDECFVRCDEAAPTVDALATGSVDGRDPRAAAQGANDSAARRQASADAEASDAESARVILEAHRTLSRMNASNRAMFRSVVEALEQELRPR